MKRVGVIIVLNLIIVVAEIIFGLLANSMALIADALHNFGDVIAVMITFVALYFGQRKATLQMTFGYHRAEMMAAFLNALFLMLTMMYLIYETLQRLGEPPHVEGSYVMIVAAIALLANAFSAYLLHRAGHDHHHEHEHHHHDDDHDHGDLNIHSAFLHMLSDAMISLAVVVGGAVIYFYDTYWVDPVLTLGFSLYILYITWPLLKKSFWSLMDSHNKDLEAIVASVEALDKVEGLSDVHLTVPSSTMAYFSANITLEQGMELAGIEALLLAIEKHLLQEYGINHTVLQPSLKSTDHLLCKEVANA